MWWLAKCPQLQNVELYSLDLGRLQAGASVKGEFEKRLKGVIDAIKQSPKPIILFIDEAHTLIGSGNQEGAVMRQTCSSLRWRVVS